MTSALETKEKVTERAEQELGRFFTLAGLGVSNLKMPAGAIDEVWHQKLKNHEQYSSFCNETAGSFVQHAPAKGYGELEWVSDYEQRFGKLDPAWFTNKEGKIDQPKYAAYLKDGKVSMEWDCVPIMTTS
jgi:hypothetical protein